MKFKRTFTLANYLEKISSHDRDVPLTARNELINKGQTGHVATSVSVAPCLHTVVSLPLPLSVCSTQNRREERHSITLDSNALQRGCDHTRFNWINRRELTETKGKPKTNTALPQWHADTHFLPVGIVLRHLPTLCPRLARLLPQQMSYDIFRSFTYFNSHLMKSF